MHILMQSASLIVTTLWTSICKPINWLEVSRIAGFNFIRINANIFWWRTPRPPTPPFQYISARLSTINKVSKVSHCTAFIKIKMYALYFDTPVHVLFFCFSLFWGKNCAPQHFSSLSYAVGNLKVSLLLSKKLWHRMEHFAQHFLKANTHPHKTPSS